MGSFIRKAFYLLFSVTAMEKMGLDVLKKLLNTLSDFTQFFRDGNKEQVFRAWSEEAEDGTGTPCQNTMNCAAASIFGGSSGSQLFGIVWLLMPPSLP